MAASVASEGQKRRNLVLRPSSRTTHVSVSGFHGVSQSTRHTNNVVGLSRRKSLSLESGSTVLEKSVTQTPGQAVRVFDEDRNDVTPEPLFPADPGAVPGKGSRFFLDEIPGSMSYQMSTTGSFSMHFSRSVLGSSRKSSQSIESLNEDVEDVYSKRDMPISFPDVQKRRSPVKEHLTEDLLKEVIHVYISETDNVSLTDIPSSMVSVDADDAKAVIERNSRYAEGCKSRHVNKKYVDRSMLTLNGAAKNEQVQSDCVVMVDSAMNVTCWDMFNARINPEQEQPESRPKPARLNHPQAAVDGSRAAEWSQSEGSTASTVSAASSLREPDASGNCSNVDQLIMLSEKFKESLLVMERSVLGNIFQPKLAAYRQLPALEDAHRLLKPKAVGQREEDADSPPSAAAEHLWTFSCELSTGRRVSSLAWNKRDTDLLAVGYGESGSSNQEPGLVCCWSLKNPTWPDRVIHCNYAVTALDFSSNHPSQLAVGMQDGSIAVYDVQSEDESCVISCSDCLSQHWGPVWQLRWRQQEFSVTGQQMAESLFSVAADGRVSRWFVSSGGLDCIDMMKIKKSLTTRKKAGGNRAEMKKDCVQSALTPGLCLDFHPDDSSIYLVGTWDGLIHRCSCSNSQQFLESYRKHSCPVSSVSWCPLSPDVFLSCSSDWTIQLWRRDHPRPILGFTSAKRPVNDVQWSPDRATLFGAVNEGQLEIWDLNSSLLDPVIVQPVGPDVKPTSLLFAPQIDCVLVGDSNGQVTVYQLKNLSVGWSSQVDILEDIIRSAASRQI